MSRVPSDLDPAETAIQAREAILGRLGEPGLHSAAGAIDPRTWELVTFTLHSSRPDVAAGELYEVPHVSAPDAAGLRSELPA